MVGAGEPPRCLTLGRQSQLDRRSSYWAHRYVQNLAQMHYGAMIGDIQAASELWEGVGANVVAHLHAQGANLSAAALKQRLDQHAESVLDAWWQLSDDLMVKYADGGRTVPRPDGSVISTPLGYPKGWLQQVNFTGGPSRLPPPAGFDDAHDDALEPKAAAAGKGAREQGAHEQRAREQGTREPVGAAVARSAFAAFQRQG